MDYLEIKKSNLSGSVDISGSKNATLPILAMSILADTPTNITNLPNVQDINTFLVLLENLGAKLIRGENKVTIDAKPLNNTKATYDIVKQMRASILVLGPLLSRFGHCEVSLPGGCAIGQRPIDLHLKAMEKMGAKIELKQGYVLATAPDGLKGCDIIFDKVTVGGTENTMLAAALAKGVTKIINAAKEPEIVQLANELVKAGVKITGIGTSELVIEGTNGKLLDFGDIEVIADRIEAATYLCAAGITNSCITINKVVPEDMLAILDKFEEMGFSLEKSKTSITIQKNDNIKPVKITTKEYPGFPTDVQAQFMALACKAKGTSIIEERLFENRFMHVSELCRMGANISLKDRTATIIGKEELNAADVMATDLRASASLVIAALSCENTTNVHRIYHLDRGYENLEEKLKSLGANIKRLSTKK